VVVNLPVNLSGAPRANHQGTYADFVASLASGSVRPRGRTRLIMGNEQIPQAFAYCEAPNARSPLPTQFGRKSREHTYYRTTSSSISSNSGYF